jgi:hypothetical protein
LQATTAQTGGPNKGIDDFSDSSCGNHPGPDLAYSVVLNERSILDVTVVSAFDSVTYVRSSDCEDGAEVACGTDVLATEPLEPGTYYLFIDSTALDQAGPFTLIVQKTPAPLPQNDSCATAQSLGVVGESVIVAGTSLYAVDQYQGTCGGVGGEDVVYSFATAQVKDLHVTLEGAFDSVLYLRANSCADGFTVSCSADGSLDVGGLSPGAYFLFVDGAQPDQAGDFQLTVALN